MSTLDLLLFRPRPVELRTARSKSEVLDRLRHAFPARDLWALAVRPFGPAVNVGTFVGDDVCLRIIDLRQRDWVRPELHGQVCAHEYGCTLVGAFRCALYARWLHAFGLCFIAAFAGTVTWSITSSRVATLLLSLPIVIIVHGLVVLRQSIQAAELQRAVTSVIDAQT